MNKLFSTILFVLFGTLFSLGQNNLDSSNTWDKIIIRDSNGGFSYFESDFQIKRQDFLLTGLNKPDSIIKKIDPKLAAELVDLIVKTKDSVSFKNPLLSFGRDSVWLINNAERLWKEYTRNWKRTKQMDSIAISTIKDYKKANQAASSIEGSRSTDDYPLIVVGIIKDNDTLSAYTVGQRPYMLPWIIKKRKVYNSRISELLAELLPDQNQSNKERLSGKDFNSSLVSSIYNSFLNDKDNYLEAQQKYPRTFKALEKNFEISKAEIMDMSSIEWGKNFGGECLEMSLKDLSISKNIEFYTISGANEIFSTKRSIISNKENLINLLQENPVYKYTLNCNNCLGEIHWVKSKSFSKKAQNHFKEDLQEAGIDKNKYDGQYKDAIFFELTEHRNSQRSFSRWIFLKNKTLILWELKGNFLMNLPKELLENQGFICKEIIF
ncbi:hypothetical protein HNP37_004040 [Flavobacterium nitrogenifigens]|uniref:Uncharacterized protein n=2 Tax=Flavobacterium TaxID=237 RepID=A0A7W7N8I5_9FLAO|nr:MULTISPECIES: hypothetical protein [Flavobacterium]MBB4803960.1 hypothetical protein [Flavobacterium nitrogenifigens]MBB6388888.1 hypothetical protein [Flavobacterium notoginsengisoli]